MQWGAPGAREAEAVAGPRLGQPGKEALPGTRPFSVAVALAVAAEQPTVGMVVKKICRRECHALCEGSSHVREREGSVCEGSDVRAGAACTRAALCEGRGSAHEGSIV